MNKGILLKFKNTSKFNIDSRFYGSVLNGFLNSVGNTPLIKLEKLSKEVNANILVKAESLNPGGSVKDRAALYLIKNAIESKKISWDKGQPIIVEGTAGNTGIGRVVIKNFIMSRFD